MSGAAKLTPLAADDGLTQRAYREIRKAILSGRLEPGSLTSVRELSDALGISRTPVREALVELANERLVEFERNRGVHICVTQRHDIEEIFELRLLLEVPSVTAAVARLTPQELDELRDCLRVMRANLTDEAAFMDADWRFHRILLGVSHNERLVAFVEGLRNQTRMRGISTAGRSRSLAAIVAQHEEIFEAVAGGDPRAASAAMANHLQTTRDLLLAQEDSDADTPTIEEES